MPGWRGNMVPRFEGGQGTWEGKERATHTKTARLHRANGPPEVPRTSRDGRIRTGDPLNPIQVRYRAAPRPVSRAREYKRGPLGSQGAPSAVDRLLGPWCRGWASHWNPVSEANLKALRPPKTGRLVGLTPPKGLLTFLSSFVAGWSSLVARRAHNPKVAGSNPAPATSQAPPMAAFATLGPDGGPGRNGPRPSTARSAR
jgi:hypothetical protein